MRTLQCHTLNIRADKNALIKLLLQKCTYISWFIVKCNRSNRHDNHLPAKENSN